MSICCVYHFVWCSLCTNRQLLVAGALACQLVRYVWSVRPKLQWKQNKKKPFVFVPYTKAHLLKRTHDIVLTWMLNL